MEEDGRLNDSAVRGIMDTSEVRSTGVNAAPAIGRSGRRPWRILAAALVAFGAGMLLSALIPASEKEARVAGQAVEAAKEHGQPVIEEAKSVGQQIGADLKESATESAQQVKDTAQESVATVKAEGQSSAQTVKDDATPSS